MPHNPTFNLRILKVCCAALFSVFALSSFGVETNPATNLRTNSATNVISTLGIQAVDTNKLGAWIWASETLPQQLCRFWKRFKIPAGQRVTKAQLLISADNAFRLYLDGREIGRGSEWRRLTEYDLSLVLEPGDHILAIEAFNDYAQAGLIIGLSIDLANGTTINVVTDESWRIAPNNAQDWAIEKRPPPDWPKATVVAAMGDAPWWKNPLTIAAPIVLPIHLRFWQQGWFQITLISICVLVVGICVRLAAKLALQSKTQELLQRERARIARDIHDDLGASLTQLVLQGEVAQKDLPVNSEIRCQIDGLCEKARDVLRSAEEIIWVVNSRRDTLSDFASYVCKYAQNFLNATPIRCRLEIEPGLPALPFDLPIRRNLFLAVKEAINNAAKYSDATELFLRIRRSGQNIQVEVEDNGKGFDPQLANRERNGLTNMSQRMNEVHGTCRLTSQPGRGCKIEFVAPLVHSHRKRFFWWRKNQSASGNGENPKEMAPADPARSI